MFIKWIEIAKPDIICLNETHVSDDVQDHEIKIDNYNIIRTNTCNNRTGGVISFIKKNIKFNVLLSTVDISDRTWTNAFQLNTKDKITICNIYRSPNSNISKFCSNVMILIDNLIDLGNAIVVGDFNINVKKKIIIMQKKF